MTRACPAVIFAADAGRLRFRAARRADRPAPGRRAQRVAAARRHRRHRAPTAVFRDLPGLLRAGDLLVFNDTRVIKARLLGVKASGGAVEVLVERVLRPNGSSSPSCARASRPSRAPRSASPTPSMSRSSADAGPTTSLFHLRFPGDAVRAARAARPRAAAALHRARRRGRRRASLPDGVRRPARAPSPRRPPRCTSTPRCSPRSTARGVERCARDAARGRRHVPAGAQRQPRRARDAQRVVRGAAGDRRCRSPRTRARGGRVVAVGTTTVCARSNRRRWRAPRPSAPALAPQRGETRIFITPGYRVPASSTGW